MRMRTNLHMRYGDREDVLAVLHHPEAVRPFSTACMRMHAYILGTDNVSMA